MTTKYFVYPTDLENLANYDIVEVSESELLDGQYGDDGALIAEVTEDNNTYTIAAQMWYSDEGVCSMTVNGVSLKNALIMFGAMVHVSDDMQE